MTPIFSPDYWRVRIAEAGSNLRDSVYAYACGAKWDEMDDLWRKALARHVAADTAILDVGCGYGRLLTLMPKHWGGYYVGTDVSPEFVAIAKRLHPGYADQFCVRDFRLRQLGLEGAFDLAVCGMVRGMVRLNAPDEWPGIEANVKRCARAVLYLEEFGEDPE